MTLLPGFRVSSNAMTFQKKLKNLIHYLSQKILNLINRMLHVYLLPYVRELVLNVYGKIMKSLYPLIK